MTSKRNPSVPAPTDDDDELSKLINNLGADEGAPAAKATKAAPKSTTTKSTKPTSQSEQDLLAELESYTVEQRPGSRPATPKLASTTQPGATRSPKRGSTATPPPGSSRTSEDKVTSRKSGESSRSFHHSLTVGESTTSDSAPAPDAAPAPASGGWWGALTATASATLKQAEAAVKEIQANEEAKRWTSQVQSNVSSLRGNALSLRDRALPTFTTILHTLAPPISSHERLQIHITHDFIGYPSLDPLIYQTFSRVMAQVEGGDLLVIQRGQESSPRRGSDPGAFTGTSTSSTSGWSDGPWWRQPTSRRTLSPLTGLPEATKLVRVAADTYAEEFYAALDGGVEAAAKRATEELSESNPVRRSDIFLAIQAVGYTQPNDLFPSSATASSSTDEKPKEEGESLLTFAIHLTDPIHSITFSTLTQTIPQSWVDWMEESPTSESTVPSLGAGGIDPREWVAEWIEEVLGLGIGVIAQRYVARRMGVDGAGSGGAVGEGEGVGKLREGVVESGGGEAARAI